jgi:hypothetical protein
MAPGRAVAIILVVTYAACLYLISSPTKFIRVKTAAGAASCWVNPAEEGSAAVCCDGNEISAPCYPFMQELRVLVTPLGAWGVPLVFPLLTLLLRALFGSAGAWVFPLKRIVMYALVIAYRTFALYLGADAAQAVLRTSFGVQETTGCWYNSLQAQGRHCSSFQFADHLVMFITHYFVITAFETFALSKESTGKTIDMACACLGGGFALSACLAVAYSAAHTAMHFHTRAEVFTAHLVVLCCVQVPLMGLYGRRYLRSLIHSPPARQEGGAKSK